MISAFHRWRAGYFTLIALFGVWAIFYRPWKVALPQRIVSDSYAVGFSNRAAFLGLGATLSLLFCGYLWLPIARDQFWEKQLYKLFRPFRVSPTEYLVPLALALFHGILICLWYRSIPTADYGEMGYTVSRFELILLGKVPYQNFEWNYGPLLLYLPVAIVRVSSFSISSDAAYIISLLLCTLVSYCAVYFVISQLRLTTSQRIIIFFLLCLPFNVSLGINCTPLRFITPFAALFLLQRRSLALRNTTPLNQIGTALIMGISLLVCFLISPETGVVFFFGSTIFSLIKLRTNARSAWIPLIIAPLAGIAPIVFYSRSYLLSMAAFGGGAGNFPIVPSASVLLYLFTVTLVVPRMGVYGWKNRYPQAALSLALSMMITMFAVAALGRCDIGHIFLNGMGAFILGLALFLRLRVRFNPYPILFLLVFTVSYPCATLLQYGPLMSLIYQENLQKKNKFNRNFFSSSFHNTPQMEQLKQKLTPFRQIGTPLGSSEEVEIMLKSSGLYTTEYYPFPSLEARTPFHLQRKLLDLKRMKYILVEKRKMVVKPFNLARYSRLRSDYISQVLLFPVPFQVKNIPLFPEEEIVRYINSHFEKVATFGHMVLLRNRHSTPISSFS